MVNDFLNARVLILAWITHIHPLLLKIEVLKFGKPQNRTRFYMTQNVLNFVNIACFKWRYVNNDFWITIFQHSSIVTSAWL